MLFCALEHPRWITANAATKRTCLKTLWMIVAPVGPSKLKGFMKKN